MPFFAVFLFGRRSVEIIGLKALSLGNYFTGQGKKQGGYIAVLLCGSKVFPAKGKKAVFKFPVVPECLTVDFK